VLSLFCNKEWAGGSSVPAMEDRANATSFSIKKQPRWGAAFLGFFNLKINTSKNAVLDFNILVMLFRIMNGGVQEAIDCIGSINNLGKEIIALTKRLIICRRAGYGI